jgi:hypothetical protein
VTESLPQNGESPRDDGLTPGRLLRTGLVWGAALLAILGLAVCVWAGSPLGVASFACQAVVDLVLACWILRRPSEDRLAWSLRSVGCLWFFVSVPIAVAFAFAPSAWDRSKLLGIEPGVWIALAAFSGLALPWLASAGRWRRAEAHPDAPAIRRLPGRWRRRLGWIGTMALLAASVLPVWPIAGIAATIQMGGCAPVWLVPSDPVFCVRGTIEGRTLAVSGETNLPDGSIVNAWIDDPLNGEWPTVRQLTVARGAFSGALDLSQVRANRASVVVEFQVAPLEPTDPSHDIYRFGDSEQPQAVVDRYGVDGARMVGPTAVWEQGPLLFYSVPELQALRFEWEFPVPE